MKEVDAGFFSAIKMGSLSGVKKWLERGANLHAINKQGQTVLMLCPHIEVFEWLIGEGLDVNARGKMVDYALDASYENIG